MIRSPNIEFWIGVVEDVNDPLKLGRARIRVFGYHSESKSDIPTDSLPWAHPLLPVTSAAMNGIGFSPSGVVPGTHVMGFFQDGETAQEPVFGWTLPGIPRSLPKVNRGFNDPTGTYPKFIDESDVSRLARNENIDKTVIQSRRDSRKTEIGVANSDSTWEEPATQYDSVYPKNHVIESESGHVIEVDDTTEKERLSVTHRSGSFIEVGPTGTCVTKIVGDSATIVEGEFNQYVDKTLRITTGADAKILINNSIDIESKNGSVTVVVKNGNVNLRVEKGNVDSEITGNVEQYITGNVKERVAGSMKQTIDGNYFLKCGGTVTIRGASINLN